MKSANVHEDDLKNYLYWIENDHLELQFVKLQIHLLKMEYVDDKTESELLLDLVKQSIIPTMRSVFLREKLEKLMKKRMGED